MVTFTYMHILALNIQVVFVFLSVLVANNICMFTHQSSRKALRRLKSERFLG